MFLKIKQDHHLVEILTMNDLINPLHQEVIGRLHYGEEPGEPEKFAKADLVFPSGEPLPRCWTDIHYRDAELFKRLKINV